MKSKDQLFLKKEKRKRKAKIKDKKRASRRNHNSKNFILFSCKILNDLVQNFILLFYFFVTLTKYIRCFENDF